MNSWYRFEESNGKLSYIVVSKDYINNIRDKINFKRLEKKVEQIEDEEIGILELDITQHPENPNLFWSINNFQRRWGIDFCERRVFGVDYDKEKEIAYVPHNLPPDPLFSEAIKKAFLLWADMIEDAQD